MLIKTIEIPKVTIKNNHITKTQTNRNDPNQTKQPTLAPVPVPAPTDQNDTGGTPLYQQCNNGTDAEGKPCTNGIGGVDKKSSLPRMTVEVDHP